MLFVVFKSLPSLGSGAPFLQVPLKCKQGCLSGMGRHTTLVHVSLRRDGPLSQRLLSGVMCFLPEAANFMRPVTSPSAQPLCYNLHHRSACPSPWTNLIHLHKRPSAKPAFTTDADAQLTANVNVCYHGDYVHGLCQP